MAIYNIRDYIGRHTGKKPRQISFHSATYRDMDDKDKSLNIAVQVPDGDVDGVLETAIENGGIAAHQDDGTLVFIPWPCAAVEIKEL